MSQFISNLKFIGYTLFPKTRSKKLKDFNKTLFAEYLEMDLSALSRWLSGDNPISRINLLRIANKASNYFKLPITPDILNRRNLEKYIEEQRSQQYIINDFERNIIADRPIIDDIIFLLNKHIELQPLIYELLNKYDKKCQP